MIQKCARVKKNVFYRHLLISHYFFLKYLLTIKHSCKIFKKMYVGFFFFIKTSQTEKWK